MRRLKFLPIFFLSFLLSTAAFAVKIGVIVPIQHKAMEEIIAGIQETLASHLSSTDEIIVQNANGDAMLQRQIIQQMVNTGVDYFLPIGTTASLMTLSMVKNKPVICVAAMIESATLQQGKKENMGCIHDEIEVSHLLAFIKEHFPQIKKLGLIYGNSEKISPEVAQAADFCRNHNLEFLSQKVDSLAEVHQFAQSLISRVDALLVLKDLTVVSAISGLAGLAEKNQKLLIAMDDGSVQGGAHFGLGVEEKEIGIAAGQSLVEALQGNPEKAFSVKKMENFTIFCNEKTLRKQKMISLEALKEAAQKGGYKFDLISAEKK